MHTQVEVPVFSQLSYEMIFLVHIYYFLLVKHGSDFGQLDTLCIIIEHLHVGWLA